MLQHENHQPLTTGFEIVYSLSSNFKVFPFLIVYYPSNNLKVLRFLRASLPITIITRNFNMNFPITVVTRSIYFALTIKN